MKGREGRRERRGWEYNLGRDCDGVNKWGWKQQERGIIDR